MSGGRDHLGDKLMRELKTAFALMSKSLQTDGIDTGLSVHSVIYPTEFPSQSHEQPSNMPTSVPTIDGMDKPRDYQSDALPLVQQQVDLVDESCQWDAVLVSEPVVSKSNATLQKVSFENLKPQQSDLVVPEIDPNAVVHDIPIPTSTAVAYQSPIQKLQQGCKTYSLDVSHFRKRSRSVPSQLWQLPILKAPIPPHRFSNELKSKFRKALIEKAYGENSDAPQSNIQLLMVYDRINLALFSSISQDDRSYLMCYPKPEIIQNPASAKNLGNAYLVVGNRLDTRESIKALVPMDT